MYGHPSMSAFGAERVTNIRSLVEAIKRRQLLKPRGRFTMQLGEQSFAVNLLASGHLEIDGKVPPLSVEREFDEALAAVGADLDDLLEAL